MYETHFQKRCRERGVSGVNLITLQDDIERAVGGGNEDFAETVFKSMGEGCGLYRFHVPSGVFYAVVNASVPVALTVYTQAQVRAVKKGKKFHKRYHKSRLDALT